MDKFQINELNKLKELFMELLKIVLDEEHPEGKFVINELHHMISMIDENTEDDKFNSLLSAIKVIYYSLYPKHGGLTDFFIYREDFTERVAANNRLESIENSIDIILNSN